MNKLLSIKIYKYSFLRYKLDGSAFVHNFDRDLHLFLIWEKGRNKEKEILEQISFNYKIIYCAEAKWSDSFKKQNINRLYGNNPIAKNNKLEQVGNGSFLIIVVEDPIPKYGFYQSLDKSISMSNLNLVKTKDSLRNYLGENYIHSSSSISEFFYHASLLFQTTKLQDIININQWDGRIHILEQNLAGSEGWSSLKECFSIANLCTDYVILRSYENLLKKDWENDSDIDILCSNIASFCSALNAKKDGRNNNYYTIVVDEKTVLLDIRYVGDNYYDPLWQKDMLQRKQYHENIVPVLRNDDYFSVYCITINFKNLRLKKIFSKIIRII